MNKMCKDLTYNINTNFTEICLFNVLKIILFHWKKKKNMFLQSFVQIVPYIFVDFFLLLELFLVLN